MSDIPRARKILADALLHYGTKDLSREARRDIKLALSLMTREPMLRRAPTKHRKPPVDDATRKRVKKLVKTTDLSYHQIANRVGLANGGRVSEIARR